MKRKKIFLLFAIILLLTGCHGFFMICSLNPFYIEKNIRFKPEIEGNWSALPLKMKVDTNKDDSTEVWKLMDTTCVWKIARVISKDKIKTKQGKDSVVFNPLNHYRIKLLSNGVDSAIYKFNMVLFEVNNRLYADFVPVESTGLEKSMFAAESYFKIHTLARINLTDTQVRISWLEEDNMKEMIEKKRVRVNYRWVDGVKRLLLTGSSEQLTGMIERYADETRFIDWENQRAMLKLNRIN